MLGTAPIGGTGTAALRIPMAALRVENHTFTVRHDGDARRSGTEGSTALTVVRAPTTTAATFTAPTSTTQGAVVGLTVTRNPTGLLPAEVAVRLGKGTTLVSSRTIFLTDGRGSWSLPALAAGTYRVAASVTTTPTAWSSRGQASITMR